MSILVVVLIVLLVLGPQWWARHVLHRYNSPREDFPGNGGELARHLLDRFDLQHIGVESCETGDHYDPEAGCVRLSSMNFSGRSLTAVAVAAHEVGHAIQHALGYMPLRVRTRLVIWAQWAERAGAVAMLSIPVAMAVTRAPLAGVSVFALGAGILLLPVLVHLVTLPVEWDASFGRALPLLRAGRYIPARDERAVSRILTACALTYVAASLASLLNVWRWIALLRR
jgi:Zn-dependent membrane protease YugP